MIGLKTVYYENKKQLTVIHQGIELWRTNGEHGMSHFTPNIATAEKEDLLNKVRDLSSDIAEYVAAFQNSKPLTVIGLREGYHIITEHNNIVLAAKDMGKEHGYEFVTWRYTKDHQGVGNGNYIYDYAKVKQDFATRSGLIDENKIFNDEKLMNIYRALAQYKYEAPNLKYDQEKEIKELMHQIERVIPIPKYLLKLSKQA